MACLSISCPLASIRVQSSYCGNIRMMSIMPRKNLRVQKTCSRAVSKKNDSQENQKDASVEDDGAGKASKKTKRAPRRIRKKTNVDVTEDNSVDIGNSLVEDEDKSTAATLDDDSKKVTRRGRKKATTTASSNEEGAEKKTAKRTRKKTDLEKEQKIRGESSDLEESSVPTELGSEMDELILKEYGGEDISFTYSWPPLVCCFGAAQHAFIPSGRPANRLIDHEIHESKKDMFWTPTKFVRAPGSSSSSVAIALASIGGRVTFMGKLGDDDYGQNLLYYLNMNGVQTRSVVLDPARPTAISQMKITRRGGLRMSCVKPCAEYSFVRSEINIDILKEAKMFYFNSSSLIDDNMRRTTMQAINASKKLGGVIFFDLNLPLPLWASNEETKKFIHHAWNSADIIEVTKQELEFLCGIEQTDEQFDTRDNDRSKFIHHKPEVIKPLWHENLQVLFVTNGTSKIHFYTEKDNGCVHGMEDAPISPFTGDMSISGDAIVAALMRMLTVQPHLSTDKGYLEHAIKYAIDCGVIDQWLLARAQGFPPKEGMEVSPSSEFSTLRSITEEEYRTAEEEHMMEELIG